MLAVTVNALSFGWQSCVRPAATVQRALYQTAVLRHASKLAATAAGRPATLIV